MAATAATTSFPSLPPPSLRVKQAAGEIHCASETGMGMGAGTEVGVGRPSAGAQAPDVMFSAVATAAVARLGTHPGDGGEVEDRWKGVPTSPISANEVVGGVGGVYLAIDDIVFEQNVGGTDGVFDHLIQAGGVLDDEA